MDGEEMKPKALPWTKAAGHLERMRHQQLWDLSEVDEAERGKAKPRSQWNFPAVCLVRCLQSVSFRGRKIMKTQWMPIFVLVAQTFPCAGPVPRALSWKGNVSLAPCADVTNALYIALTKLPLTAGRPRPALRFVCISGNERGLFISHRDVRGPAFGTAL